MKTLIVFLVGLVVISTACVTGAVQELPDTVQHVINDATHNRTYYVSSYIVSDGVLTFDGYWRATSRGVPQAYVWVAETKVLSGAWQITTPAKDR